MTKIRKLTILLLLLLAPALVAQTIAPVITIDHGANTAEQQAKPYVILVSLDGLRYDYATKYHATNLLNIASRGASAPEGMIPSYPSTTFPNHYSLATGLYPEHHGIVAMSFYDPERKETYSYTNPKTVTDGSWYSGVPLWSLAEKQGMRSACFFWPGSEAEIAGMRPTYYLRYDDTFPNEKRIDQVVAWLQMPAAQRPHFITLYYSKVDHAGHEFGPNSKETETAVHDVDKLVGELEEDLKPLHLPIDLIVVSDHGMEDLAGDWITLDQYADLFDFETVGPLLYPKTDTAAAAAYQKLKGASDKFEVYRRSDIPAYLHYDSNARIGDPVIVPTGPYRIRAHAPPAGAAPQSPTKGGHGYNPRTMITMRAVFYAEGPDIRRGATLAPFENVDVYPLVAHILGLRIGPIDGSLGPVKSALRQPSGIH